MRASLLALGFLVLTGCATLPIPFAKPADTVKFDRVKLALARGDVKAGVVALEMRAATGCATGKLSGEACLGIQRLIDQARALDDQLVKALLDPQVEVDWAEVAKVLRLVVDLALKFI